MKFNLLLCLLLISSPSFADNMTYKVEKGDTLSTILYSIGIFKKGELKKSIKNNAKINKLDSEDLIKKDEVLELKVEKPMPCNINESDSNIKIYKKFKKKSMKDLFLKAHPDGICEPISNGKYLCHMDNKIKKNYKHKFFFGFGMEDTSIEKPAIFEGAVKSRDLIFYDLELNIGHNPGKSRIYLLHSLSFVSYKKSRKNTNTMEFAQDYKFKPTYGLQIRSDNTLHNASIALMLETHLLAKDKDVDTLEMATMYAPTLQIGIHLTPWHRGLFEMTVSGGPGTGHSIQSVATQKIRLTQQISNQTGLMIEAFHTDVNGRDLEQYTNGLKGALKFDF